MEFDHKPNDNGQTMNVYAEFEILLTTKKASMTLGDMFLHYYDRGHCPLIWVIDFSLYCCFVTKYLITCCQE